MTKILLAVRHRELWKTNFDLDAVLAGSIMTHTAFCRHAGWQSLGGEGGQTRFSRACAKPHIC